jgi:hypothetical protein
MRIRIDALGMAIDHDSQLSSMALSTRTCRAASLIISVRLNAPCRSHDRFVHAFRARHASDTYLRISARAEGARGGRRARARNGYALRNTLHRAAARFKLALVKLYARARARGEG